MLKFFLSILTVLFLLIISAPRAEATDCCYNVGWVEVATHNYIICSYDSPPCTATCAVRVRTYVYNNNSQPCDDNEILDTETWTACQGDDPECPCDPRLFPDPYVRETIDCSEYMQ